MSDRIEQLTRELMARGFEPEWPVTGCLLLEGVEVPHSVVDDALRYGEGIGSTAAICLAYVEAYQEESAELCGHCNGSGEGLHEFARCIDCRGSGELPKRPVSGQC